MFNPYVSGREDVLRPAPKAPGGPERLLKKLGKLDREDLLILAILLLSMKQDGASPTELLIAVGLYLWL